MDRVAREGVLFTHEYPYANEGDRGFYEKRMSGKPVTAGWVNESDFEKAPLE